jgi:glycosyltransferase involved in cell wall biosynthesis
MKIDDRKLKGLKMTCIYYTALDDWRGGTAGLKNMLHIFKKLGIKTDLISYSYYSNKFCIEHENINPLLNSTTIHLPSYLPKFIKASSIFLAFVHAWRPTKKCDIIFAHLDVLSGVPAVILGRLFGKPAILHYIDEDPHHLPDTIYKYIIKNADVVFAISPYLMDKAKKYGCQNIAYLPAFVDTKLFSRDTSAWTKIRAELGIKDDDIVIGYAGGFPDIEGVSVLLYAFKNLTKSYHNIKMIIMGGKQSKNDENIQKLVNDLNIEDKVILVPPQPHEEVPKFLSACDITCCPKIDCAINRAANPIKVVEYLSMGLPTVCSAIGGITDTIEDGADGFLVKPGDVKDLEEKLEWIILNPERAKEIGENGRKTAIEKYSYEAIENTIRKAISEIMGRKKGKMMT